MTGGGKSRSSRPRRSLFASNFGKLSGVGDQGEKHAEIPDDISHLNNRFSSRGKFVLIHLVLYFSHTFLSLIQRIPSFKDGYHYQRIDYTCVTSRWHQNLTAFTAYVHSEKHFIHKWLTLFTANKHTQKSYLRVYLRCFFQLYTLLGGTTFCDPSIRQT